MAILTCTYDDTTARVQLSATSLPVTADVVLFETSVDNVHWRQVRGGSAVAVASSAASVFDYEFAPGVTNYYRASAIDLDPPIFVSGGAAATAVGVAVIPGLPAGYDLGYLLVVWAAIRNSSVGTVVCPTGYTVMFQTDNIGLFGKRAGAAGTEAAPIVNVTGGVTGASGSDVIAQMACFRNLERTPAAFAYQLDPAAININYPGLAAFQPTWTAALYLGWNQDDWTSVAAITGTTQIGAPTSTGGLDAGLVWAYQLMATPAPVVSGAFVVTGTTSVVSYGATVALRSADYVTRVSTTIIPNMSAVWMKFPSAPYMNRSVILTDWTDLQRASRSSANTIVGKLSPSAVTDLHSPYSVTVTLQADNDADVAAVDLALSAGNIMLLHIPALVALPSLYAMVGTHQYARLAHLSHRVQFTVPLTAVSMPDLSIVGNQVTWATLLTLYQDWNAVSAANATWGAVLALQGSPQDALVGH